MLRIPTNPGWACLLLSCVLYGCSEAVTKSAQESAGQSLAQATTVQPQRKSLVRTIELAGRVDAYEVTPLFAKVTGYVVNIPVDIGDTIEGPHDDQPGTLLCELQVPELKEELLQKQAVVAQVRAEVLQAEAGIKVADAAVRSSQAKVTEARATIDKEEAVYSRWQSEYQRVSQLAETGAVTKKVAEETKAQFEAADAGRKEAAARVASVESLQEEALADQEKAQADAVAARSRLDVAQADQRRVAALLGYTQIRAPFDGVVVERTIHTGHLVQAGTTGQKPLLTVMRSDPVRVSIDVPEIDAVHVTPETRVELKLPSLPGSAFEGPISRSSWSLNQTSRTMSVEIHVPNPDGVWRPGQYVQAKLTAAEIKNGLILPKSAIVSQDKQTFCLAVNGEQTVVRIPVAVGLQAGAEVEIRSGLSGNEQIISLNASAFREGQKVESSPQVPKAP